MRRALRRLLAWELGCALIATVESWISAAGAIGIRLGWPLLGIGASMGAALAGSGLLVRAAWPVVRELWRE